MAETEQVRPLAPARDQQSSDEEGIKSKKNKRAKLCGFVCSGSLLLLLIVIVILVFTVFKVKKPKITTNSITITNLDLVLNQNPNLVSSSVKLNMSLLLDMSIKNPNSASFKFGNTTTTVDYRGVTVAEARTPPGMAKARRTFRMNVTVDILADRLTNIKGLITDVAAQLMTMNTYTFVEGRVKVLAIKKHIKLWMNCTISVNLSSKQIQDMNCKTKVKL